MSAHASNVSIGDVVVVGVSAGALEALSTILPRLPKNYPRAIIVVVHLPPDKKSLMAPLLQSKCSMRVIEAEDKEPVLPGTVYIAPPDYHLLAEPNASLSLSAEEPILYSRPSIDLLFETAADAYGSRAIGIVLTGANHDGAQGLAAIAAAGGTVLVQHPETAYARAMPEAAIRSCPDAQVLSLEQIAAYLQEIHPS